MTVSLCMIVKDEEANLDACLASAEGLADEIVIVDTGSTDGTKKIARRYDARLFDFAWRDDFAAARNESIRRASGDWIFWLDADDRIERASRLPLEQLLSSLPDSRDGYMMRCLCTSRGELGTHEVAHVRLFRNDPRLRFRYRVHEQIAPAIRRAGGDLRSTDVTIEHVGYRDPAVYERKQARNLRLLELECDQNPVDPFVLFYRGTALLDLGRPAEALISLLWAQNLVPKGTAVAQMLPVHLADAYVKEGLIADAEETLRAAVAAYPSNADLAFASATHFYRRGQLVVAEAMLVALLIAAPSGQRADVFAGDPSIVAFRARHLLAAVRYVLGDSKQAELDARCVVDRYPEFGDGWLLLGDILIANGKLEAQAVLARTLEQTPDTESACVLMRASACIAQGDWVGAQSQLDDGLKVCGAHPYLTRAAARIDVKDARRWRNSAYFLSTRDLPLL